MEPLDLSQYPDIPSDCRNYTGYKPCCRPGDEDSSCARGSRRGTEILIIKLAAMGDALRTKCLLSGLKRAHPLSRITWLTERGTEPIVRDPRVDEVRALTLESVLALQGREFDLLYCFDKEPHALSLSRSIQATRKFGYAPTRHNTCTVWNEASLYALRLGISDELKYRQNTLSHQQILYSMAELEYQDDCYDLSISSAATANAAALLHSLSIPQERPIIGINTGCGPVFETKGWTVDGFCELVSRLGARGDVSVLLLGGPREQALHARIRAAIPASFGRTVFDSGTDNSLETFFALIDRCAVLLSADTLAMHVGIALRKHTVAFFGPTCQQEVDLYGRGEKIVTDYPCSPCYLKSCSVIPACIPAITAATMEAALLRQLVAAT